MEVPFIYRELPKRYMYESDTMHGIKHNKKKTSLLV